MITLKMASFLLPFLQAGTLRRQTLKRVTCAAHIPGRVISLAWLAIIVVLPSVSVTYPEEVGGALEVV
jgi:hypothetical protein